MLRGFDLQKKLGLNYDYLLQLEQIHYLEAFSEGAYSSVYRVKRQEDNEIYALKMVKLKDTTEQEKQNALNEVRIIASLRSINLVCYKECFIESKIDALCIVMDYANQGDLLQKIQENIKQGTYMKEEEIWDIFIQVVKGLKSMHDKHIMHRDIKSANVFLYDDNVAKLGDFNVSKLQKKSLLYTQTGTPYYACPEIWKDMPYDKKADIWSLGCVLYEMTALKPPFKANDMQQLYKKIVSGQFAKIPDFYSSDLSYVIDQLLQVQSYYRPSCGQILEFNAVKKYMKEKHKFEVDDRGYLHSTINIPPDFKSIQLPKPNYDPFILKLQQQQIIKTQQNINKAESDDDLDDISDDEYIKQDHKKKSKFPQVQQIIQQRRMSTDVQSDQYKVVENVNIKIPLQQRNSSLKNSPQVMKTDNSPLNQLRGQRQYSLSNRQSNQVSTPQRRDQNVEVQPQIIKQNINGQQNLRLMALDQRNNNHLLKQLQQKKLNNKDIFSLNNLSNTPDKLEKHKNSNSISYSTKSNNNNIISQVTKNNNNSIFKAIPLIQSKQPDPQGFISKLQNRQSQLSPNLKMKKSPLVQEIKKNSISLIQNDVNKKQLFPSIKSEQSFIS